MDKTCRDKVYRRPNLSGLNGSAQKVSPTMRFSDNVSADKTYQRTKPIGRQNLLADKTYRRTKLIDGQKLSAEKTYQL
jgi:hypothetical protein